jgi:hypothetical protein
MSGRLPRVGGCHARSRRRLIYPVRPRSRTGAAFALDGTPEIRRRFPTPSPPLTLPSSLLSSLEAKKKEWSSLQKFLLASWRGFGRRESDVVSAYFVSY